MTIDTAIRLIQADIDDEDVDWESLLGRAYKLSFEALKREQNYRLPQFKGHVRLLPSETKD